MAGDWIKMRVWLRRDPCVASMADFLATDRRFMDFVTDPVQRTCDRSIYEHITRDITRAITVTALLEVWGVARERGDRDGDDLVLKHCTLDVLDDICGVPGFGEAMDYIEWACQEESQDSKGRAVFTVRFPKFFKEQESPDERYKKQHAEAQARYRNKQKLSQSDASVDVASDVTGDITVTPREEKRREEISPSLRSGDSAPPQAEVTSAPKASKPKAQPMVQQPDDVDERTWSDWLALRRAKKAPVTATVLSEARSEAEKAGIPLQRFLRIWCIRGSQGLQADWLKPAELQARPPPPLNRQEALEARNRAVGQQWLAEQGIEE